MSGTWTLVPLNVICHTPPSGRSVALSVGSTRDVCASSSVICRAVASSRISCAIEAPEFHYLVLYGVSANARARWDNPAAARIGFVPRDNAEDYANEVAGKAPPAGDPAAEFHGGSFCALEWTGDARRID